MSLTVNDIYRFDEFELVPSSRRFTRNGAPISLYPKAYEVLTYLVANPGRVITKEEIFKSVWPDSFVEEGNLARQISSLRRAMGDRAECIITIPGRGYQFAVGVERSPSSDGFSQDQTEAVLLQRVRERTQVVIEESFPAPAAPARLSRLGRIPRNLAAWSVLALVIVGAATLYIWKRFSKLPELRKVLVADVMNLTGDPSFDITLKSVLVAGIAQSPWIQIMGAGEVNSVLTAMEKPLDTPLLGETALEVCKRAGYQAMLRPGVESSLDKTGYRTSMEVVECATGSTIAMYKASARNKDEVLGTLDSLSLRARRKLGEPNKSMDEFQVPFYNVTTSSFEALQAYFQGVKLGRAAKFGEAIPYFEKAVEIDPKFAWAQSALGVTYYNLGDRVKAAEYVQKAFDLSANLSQYEKLYTRYTYYLNGLHDLDAAEKDVKEWTQVYPAEMTPWEALTDVEIERGDYSEAIEAGERALQLAAQRAPSTCEVLARAYMRANRLADAKRILAEAKAQGIDSERFHGLLFEMAVIDHDAAAMQQEVDWDKGKPGFYGMLGNQGIVAADEGRYRQFEDTYKTIIPLGLKEDGEEAADSMLWEEIRIEAALGRYEKARELLKHVKDRSGIYGAVIEASAGDVATAEAYIKQPEQYPHGTLEHLVYLPEVKAILAMHRHDPNAAIKILEPVVPYEFMAPEVIDVRGNAYLALKQGEKAEAEFRKLIDNPGLEDPVKPWTVMAHLGLARAYAQQGNKTRSRNEYESFFALWKDADPDVPVLQQARLEYAQLR